MIRMYDLVIVEYVGPKKKVQDGRNPDRWREKDYSRHVNITNRQTNETKTLHVATIIRLIS